MGSVSTRRSRWRRLRPLLIGSAALLVIAFCTAVALFARAWLDAKRFENASLDCSIKFHASARDGHSWARERASGYVCVYVNRVGRVVERPIESSSPEWVAEALLYHLQALPPERSEVDQHGAVVGTDCANMGVLFRSAPVFVCDVTHENETIAIWCAAYARDEIHTHRETRGLPCLPG